MCAQSCRGLGCICTQHTHQRLREYPGAAAGTRQGSFYLPFRRRRRPRHELAPAGRGQPLNLNVGDGRLGQSETTTNHGARIFPGTLRTCQESWAIWYITWNGKAAVGAEWRGISWLGSLNYCCDCERSYREDRMDQRIAMRVRRGTCIIVHARALRLARMIGVQSNEQHACASMARFSPF